MTYKFIILSILLIWLIWQTLEYETEEEARFTALRRLGKTLLDHKEIK